MNRSYISIILASLIATQSIIPATSVPVDTKQLDGYFTRLKRGIKCYRKGMRCSKEDQEAVYQAGAGILAIMGIGLFAYMKYPKRKTDAELDKRVQAAAQKRAQLDAEAHALIHEIKERDKTREAKVAASEKEFEKERAAINKRYQEEKVDQEAATEKIIQDALGDLAKMEEESKARAESLRENAERQKILREILWLKLHPEATKEDFEHYDFE